MPASILPQVVKEFHPKTKPLSLSDPEVRALLAGATQIRIPLKKTDKHREADAALSYARRNGLPFHGSLIPAVKTPFAPGDVIAVREAWQKHENQTSFDQVESWICYRADGIPALDNGTVKPWRSAQHMPISLARIQRTVVAVRCDRISEITEADALLCGFDIGKDSLSLCGVDGRFTAKFEAEFSWHKRYGKRYPLASSWCWVIDLKEESKR